MPEIPDQKNKPTSLFICSQLEPLKSFEMVNTLENTSHVARETLGNVLVIGGCGFVGSHIVDILRSSYNAKISIVSRNCTTHHTKFSDVIYCDADISSIGSLLPVFEKLRPDVVIHTVAPPPTAASDEEFYRVSVEGTRCIIEACQKTGVKALVYTSSPSVCRGDIAHGSYANMDESKPVITGLAQKDVYSRTKVSLYIWASNVFSAHVTVSQDFQSPINATGIFNRATTHILSSPTGNTFFIVYRFPFSTASLTFCRPKPIRLYSRLIARMVFSRVVFAHSAFSASETRT